MLRKSAASGVSADNTAQNIDVTVPAAEELVLFTLVAEPDDNAYVGMTWTLECPASTVVLRGAGPTVINFGDEGFRVPYQNAGDDVRLAITAAGASIATAGSLVYRLRTASSD